MGPQDHLGALLDGIGCTVCDEPVAADRIRLLARRDDLLFLQINCARCGSSSLGFIADGHVRPEAARLSERPAITADDVLDMHDVLEAWTGDLVGLLGRSPTPPDPGAGRRSRRTGRPA